MSQIKRRLSLSQAYDVQTKKVRTTTCFENFSNELFHEIFDYLDGCDIYKAFANLNIRFQNILNHSLFPLKINLNLKLQSTIEYYYQRLIISNKHRIISLCLDDELIINKFFNYCNMNSSFNRLESVVINTHNCTFWKILFYLNSLPRLFSLTIQLEREHYYNLSDLYRVIFRLPHLKYNKVSLSDENTKLKIFIPISLNEKHSTIEYLILNHCCTSNELTSILCHTPNLSHLTCQHLVETNKVSSKEVLLTLPHLTHVSIIDCDVPFDTFEVFIKKISSQLNMLSFSTSGVASYLDANRWKQLIKRHIPYLCKFHFDQHIDFYDYDNVISNHESIGQFTSSFWTERQWFFELKIDADAFIYSIHPYR